MVGVLGYSFIAMQDLSCAHNFVTCKTDCYCMRHWWYATATGFTNVPPLRVVLPNRRVALPSQEVLNFLPLMRKVLYRQGICIKLDEIGWEVLRYAWGSTKDLLSCSPQVQHRSRPTPLLIVYDILSSKKKGRGLSVIRTNNIGSLDTINNFTVADGRSNILCWLSPLERGLRRQNIQDHRVEDVGEWLLRTKEFRSWCTGSRGDASDNVVSFCYGDPGVCKTYIR